MRLLRLAYALLKESARLRDLRRAEAAAQRNVRDFEASLHYWRKQAFREQVSVEASTALVAALKAELRFPRPRAIAPFRR